jgi:hypothetical protein
VNDEYQCAPEWFCGCGSGNPKQCLADILNCFSSENSCGSPYVDLSAVSKVREKYGDAVELIAYFLDHLGYAEHSGSVMCSQSLTDKGEELRDWANNRCVESTE